MTSNTAPSFPTNAFLDSVQILAALTPGIGLPDDPLILSLFHSTMSSANDEIKLVLSLCVGLMTQVSTLTTQIATATRRFYAPHLISKKELAPGGNLDVQAGNLRSASLGRQGDY